MNHFVFIKSVNSQMHFELFCSVVISNITKYTGCQVADLGIFQRGAAKLGSDFFFLKNVTKSCTTCVNRTILKNGFV